MVLIGGLFCLLLAGGAAYTVYIQHLRPRRVSDFALRAMAIDERLEETKRWIEERGRQADAEHETFMRRMSAPVAREAKARTMVGACPPGNQVGGRADDWPAVSTAADETRGHEAACSSDDFDRRLDPAYELDREGLHMLAPYAETNGFHAQGAKSI